MTLEDPVAELFACIEAPAAGSTSKEQFGSNDWQLGVLPEAVPEAAFEGIPELERSPSEESLVISSL